MEKVRIEIWETPIANSINSLERIKEANPGPLVAPARRLHSAVCTPALLEFLSSLPDFQCFTLRSLDALLVQSFSTTQSLSHFVFTQSLSLSLLRPVVADPWTRIPSKTLVSFIYYFAFVLGCVSFQIWAWHCVYWVGIWWNNVYLLIGLIWNGGICLFCWISLVSPLGYATFTCFVYLANKIKTSRLKQYW
jgi:hypothetical protein